MHIAAMVTGGQVILHPPVTLGDSGWYSLAPTRDRQLQMRELGQSEIRLGLPVPSRKWLEFEGGVISSL